MTTLLEADIEQAAIEWLSGLDWQVLHGPDIAPEMPNAERDDYGQVVHDRRFRDALAELNPTIPLSALDDAYRKLTRPEGSTLETRNRAFHRMLVDGVEVEYRDGNGRVRGDQVRAIDFENPDHNDWLAVNQFTVTENLPAATSTCLRAPASPASAGRCDNTHRQAAQAGKNNRRPDVVLFVNGLPMGLIELKNPADDDATIWTAWNQLQTCKAELPALFSMNEVLMISDGNEARIGTTTAGWEWLKPWHTVAGEKLADKLLTELRVMLEGVFDRMRFRMPLSSALPVPPSSFRTPIRGPCSTTISASTTSSAPFRTAPRCRSITRAASPPSPWTSA